MSGLSAVSDCLSQVQCYDPETDTWLLRANIPIAKRCITAVSLNNLIYVCGGLTKSVYCYDPSQDYWIHVVHTFNKLVSGNSNACTVLAAGVCLICKPLSHRRAAACQCATGRSSFLAAEEKTEKPRTPSCVTTLRRALS